MVYKDFSRSRERERHPISNPFFFCLTLHRFPSKSERGEPWNKTETHGQNHFNSIVNVRVDSSAETLEKIIRLEAVVSYLNTLQLACSNNKRPPPCYDKDRKETGRNGENG